MSEFVVNGERGRQNMVEQMPEHMGCSHGTAKMVHDACKAWLAVHEERRFTQQEMKDRVFEKRWRKRGI